MTSNHGPGIVLCAVQTEESLFLKTEKLRVSGREIHISRTNITGQVKGLEKESG